MKSMRVLFLVSLITVIFSNGYLFSQYSSPTWNLDPYNPEYEDGVVLVKLLDKTRVHTLEKFSGSSVLNSIKKMIRIEESEQLFPYAKPPQNKMFKDYSGMEHQIGDLRTIYKLTFSDDRDAKEVAEEIAKLPDVEFAEPDYFVYAMEGNGSPLPQQGEGKPRKTTATVPNDPLYSQQWYLGTFPGVNAEAAWDSTTGDTTQIIAIIDTGVDWDHSDLDDNIWRNWGEIPGNSTDDDANGYEDDIRGWDFVNDDNNPNDDNSHGTHVAGIAAAEGNNSVGICGVAWNAKIMPIKVMQSSGRGSSSDVALGVAYAAENGATVINMSIGTYGESITVKTALENAYATAVLVAAAGNAGYKVDPPFPPYPVYAPHYPACYGFVIGVEATGPTPDPINGSYLAGFSNFDPSGPVAEGNSRGHNYEIKAPGVQIHSTFPNGGYRDLQGTSMACPVVAGAVSLMKHQNPAQSTEVLFARLVQSANNGILDIYNALDYALIPDLEYLTYTLVDTLPGCDNDGIADAGETVEIYLTVKNAGGWADSVWSKLRFAAFEDTTVANIIDSTSYIGDISAYATMTGVLDPFRIGIDPDVANNRDIVFEYEIGAANHSSFTGEIIISVQNGEEYAGLYEGLVHLTADKYYIITGNTVFDSLIIEPGTTVRINHDISMLISKYLLCEGTPDSLILFTSNGVGYWKEIKNAAAPEMNFKYCVFEYNGYWVAENATSFENCIFRYNISQVPLSGEIRKCVFKDNNWYSPCDVYDKLFEYNVEVGDCNYSPLGPVGVSYLPYIRNNAVFSNSTFSGTSHFNFGVFCGGPWDIYHLPPNYHGTTDSTEIETSILDFFENSNLPVLLGDSALVIPPTECHGIVWKIDINNVPVNKYDNPYNSPTGLGAVGTETLKYDVYFNCAMDTTYVPFLTFGVREPFTQQVVVDNASWSSDSTIWTAYFDVGLETGDGEQTIRVYGAKDTDHFEIPIENSRFQFVIQAAGAASNQFIATTGVGKVELEWPTAESDDVLGYNMYRIMQLTDSTFTDTTRINSTLVTDTLFTDFAVIPDSTYRYAYKVLGTDMAESDYSKFVTAVPVDASSGDANGDMVVNVQDVVAIVNYILEENPEPFLFEAADVNDDGFVNVLDVVGTVNLILGGTPKALLARNAGSQATLSLYKDRIGLMSGGGLAGLQFELKGDEAEKMVLKPSSALKGFEIAKTEKEGKIICVMYSLSRTIMPDGENTLFTFEERKDLDIENAVGSTGKGESIGLTVENKSNIKIPEKFTLYQNYPNPFNPETIIKYGLPQASEVKIAIYNVLGQKVRTMDVGEKEAGYHQIIWDSKDDYGIKAATGVYIYRIEAGKFVESRKMILIR